MAAHAVQSCVRGGEATTSGNKTITNPAAVRALEEAINEADLQTGRRIVGEIAAEYGYEALIFDAIEPVPALMGERRVRKGPVVLADIEDDRHPLGRKIVSAFLRINQWEVIDLGIDVGGEDHR